QDAILAKLPDEPANVKQVVTCLLNRVTPDQCIKDAVVSQLPADVQSLVTCMKGPVTSRPQRCVENAVSAILPRELVTCLAQQGILAQCAQNLPTASL